MLPKVQIRMEEDLRQKLLEAAYMSDRSLNAEILARLERSFEDDAAAKTLADLVDKHEDAIAEHDNRLHDLWRDVEDLQQAVISLRGR